MDKNPGEHDRITIPIASITERTRKILPGADAARATALKELQGLRPAKTAVYQRELERLRTQLGDRDPRVSDLERKVQTNERIVMNLGAEAQRAGTPPVVAAPGTWVCHGRVLDQSLHGESHVTVELIREQGAGDNGLTSARTDGTGYFKITVVGIDAGGAHEDVALENEREEAPDAKAPPGKAAVFVRVLDEKGDVLLQDVRPLVPRSGQTNYVEVILPPAGDADDDSPPPGGVNVRNRSRK